MALSFKSGTLKGLLMVFLLNFGLPSLQGQSSLTKEEQRIIEEDLSALARQWTAAWNGHIDSEHMMANYHPDMKYIWRGVSPPGNYQGFKQFIEGPHGQQANYELSRSNLDITLLDRQHAIVFFHFNDKNKSPYGSGAATSVMTRKSGKWEVIYVHESGIEGN